MDGMVQEVMIRRSPPLAGCVKLGQIPGFRAAHCILS